MPPTRIIPPPPFPMKEMELLPKRLRERLSFCWHNSKSLILNHDKSVTITFEPQDYKELEAFFRLRYLK
jgi:hypothetical protein